jgi:hypothetical protein
VLPGDSTNNGRRPRLADLVPRGPQSWLVLPFVAAMLVFLPDRRGRVVDEAVTAAQVARSVVGLAATVWLIYAYQADSGSVLRERVDEVRLGAVILVFAVPLVLVAFVLAAGPRLRGRYARRCAGPLLALALFVVSHILAWYAIPSWGLSLPDGNLLWALVMLPVSIVAFVVLGLFSLTAAAIAVTNSFRTADVHEVLPPLVSPVLVWAISAIQLFDASPVEAPAAVRMLFLIGPPLSVTALSYWELHRLRTHHGLTVRQALNRPGRG